MRTKNYQLIIFRAIAIIAFFASSLNSEAFLGLTRGQIKERLGDPEAKIVEVNAEKYMINNHGYIIRYDAAGAVDRCMICKMTNPYSFTPQEFNDLTNSVVSKGFETLKLDADSCLMVNYDNNNAYYASRSGERKDWVVMMTYKNGGEPDISFFTEVIRIVAAASKQLQNPK